VRRPSPVSYRALIGLVASLTVGAACRESTAPYGDIETRLEADRARVARGEVLGLRAIATNHGDEAVEFGPGCGLGLDIEVERPNGEHMFLLRELPSGCPTYDSNVLEAGETDTVSYAWTVPQALGTYRLWAGGRVREGLAARSAPVDVLVD
jgi:hypothetical protein